MYNKETIERKKLLNELLEAAKETALNSTAHAIPNIARPGVFFMRVLWLVCLIVSTAGCVYLNIKTINNYFSYEVVTNIFVVNEVPAIYPTISICNLNPFTTQYSVEFSNNITKEIVAQASTNGLHKYDENIIYKYPEFYQYYVVSSASHPQMTDEQRKQLGVPLETVLLTCTFNSIPCYAGDFEWYFDNWFGNCYRFNSGLNATGHHVPDLWVEKSGSFNGLRVELVSPRPFAESTFTRSYGAHVIVHNKSVLASYTEGYDVAVGTHTSIAINRVLSSKSSLPYSDCLEYEAPHSSHDSYLVRAFAEQNLTYRQMDCFDLCYQQELVAVCKCYDLDYKLLTFNATPCSNLTEKDCLTFRYNEFFYSGNVAVRCPLCPEECSSIIYSATLSFSDYPTANYARSLVHNSYLKSILMNVSEEEKYDVIKMSVLSLNIYYERLSYTFIEESPKFELVELVANLGGTMGLFAGVSFLSFVELVELAVNLVVIYFKSRKEKPDQSQQWSKALSF